jgi:hypothetical protein
MLCGNLKSRMIRSSHHLTKAYRTRAAGNGLGLATAAYYEWMDGPEGKVPFAVAPPDGNPVAFGGVWEEWGSPTDETLRTFATITTEANLQLAMIARTRRGN